MGEHTAEPIRVVIVDENELFRSGLAALLDRTPGIEVVGEAADGPTAVSLAVELIPDVVLLDVNLSGLAGPETCLRIKESVPSARLLVLTVSDDENDMFEAVRAGATGYVLKNSSVREVVGAVRVVAAGQSLISPAVAVRLLSQFRDLSADDITGPSLTPREMEVLRLMAMGKNNRHIAVELFISENTVKNHVRNILDKWQLHSRMEAVMYAVRQKMLDLPR